MEGDKEKSVQDEKKAARKMLRTLRGEPASARGEAPPIWVMRQAGRYLPEYRATRAKAGSFLDLCYTPDFAVEVTLQPIRRYGFDAAILFSDILVVPDALGRDVRFVEGKGPQLDPIDRAGIERLVEAGDEDVLDHLAPVMETVGRLRAELPDETTLLGFCGAPWTVATYMVAGHGTPDQMPARLMALREPVAFQALIDRLVDASAAYLIAQLRAGADAVKIFDSWAGVLTVGDVERWCVQPVREIVDKVRDAVPDATIIGFPKGAQAVLPDYRDGTGVDCLALDWTVDLETAQRLQQDGCVQGLLDPARLIAGGEELDESVDRILEALADGPFVFNLGHGITPQTPPENVARMVERVRDR